MHQYLKEKQVIFSEPKKGKSAAQIISTYLRGKKSLLKPWRQQGLRPRQRLQRAWSVLQDTTFSSSGYQLCSEVTFPSQQFCWGLFPRQGSFQVCTTQHTMKSLGRISYKPQWLEKGEETLPISGHFLCKTEFQTKVLEEGKSRGTKLPKGTCVTMLRGC